MLESKGFLNGGTTPKSDDLVLKGDTKDEASESGEQETVEVEVAGLADVTV